MIDNTRKTRDDLSRNVVTSGADGTAPTTMRKSQITLRLDNDVIEFFRATGSGYQTRMRAVLRSYMTASRAGESDS